MKWDYVYNGHDNSVQVVVEEAGVAQSLISATAMTLTVGETTVRSMNQVIDPIRWAQAGYVTGEVRMTLGHENIPAGQYMAYLVIYMPGYEDGIVWGSIPLIVVAEVELGSSSASVSPSSSPSPSASISPSISPSVSVSPSASASPSTPP